MTRRYFVFGAMAVLAGCGREPKPPAQPVRTAADDRPVILAFGDSLSAGHGLGPGSSYADFLQKELDRKGYRYRVVNEGISGDTTGGGLSRAEAAASLRPRVVILELGANDGLRGLPVEATRANLAETIDIFERAGAKIVLCGMTLPRNYGFDYIRSFEKLFRDLSREKKAALVPFFLEGVATRPELMQSDGLHPTAEGNAIVAQTVLKHLEPLLIR
ncbi:MAG: arylesterase [Acidobacteria bacterium]|nr:arylesterase [Acidobacteriota bacterium]